eukprot:5187702-Heterocapsa_arctica.AAC.1
MAIGAWKQNTCWKEACTKQRIDRVYCLFPGNQTDSNNKVEQVRGSQIGEDRSDEHSQDEEKALNLFCDSG